MGNCDDMHDFEGNIIFSTELGDVNLDDISVTSIDNDGNTIIDNFCDKDNLSFGIFD